MFGCGYGVLFQVTVGGGSYQEGMTTHIQGVPPGMLITEEEIYRDLLLRKPGQDELTSPRREPDIPIIYSGVNASDTMEGFKNRGYTNGTPFVILIPNLDRHLEHIEQYRLTNRTPRPGHASYATYQKYGEFDDSIGAGIFSGRYTCTIVAAGAVARKILARHGIEVIAYIREAAGVTADDVPLDEIKKKVAAFKEVRRRHDPVYKAFFESGRLNPGQSFVEKIAAIAKYEELVKDTKITGFSEDEIKKKHGIHPKLNCPDLEAADEMYRKITEIAGSGESSGGVVEVVATGVPAGLGEPVFRKLDGELGRMLSIAAVKAVEIGAGVGVKNMVGSESNDQMYMKGGRVCFTSNNAGGITGGVTTGQDIVVRLTVKPTPTIGKPQQTIDKVSLKDATLAAVTRRDPSIVPRVWPVAEAFAAIIILDNLMQFKAYKNI